MLITTSRCFACKCCGELPGMDQNLIDLLNDAGIQDTQINCGYRCDDHNAEVGGVAGSQHNAIPCTAADVDASLFDSVDELAEKFEALGADGVGRYPGDAGNFVHVDTRSGRIGDTFRW